MTKTATLSTTSPLVYATGQDVLADGNLGFLELVEMLNWAFLERSYEVVFSLACGTSDWDTWAAIADGVGPLNVIIAGGAATVIEAPVYFSEDQVQSGRTYLCGSQTIMQLAADTATVTFTLTGNAGSVSVINSHAFGDNGSEITGNMTIATAQSIAGWATLEVIVEQTGGVSGDNELSLARYQENPPGGATSIPDPEDS